MDLLIAISQGLGLAVAAGFVAAPPVAFGATAAYYGLDTGALDFAANGFVVAVAWIASATTKPFAAKSSAPVSRP